MPELPEVETSRRGIEPFLLNRKIKKITIRQHKLRWPVPNNLAELATGKVIRAVSRRAKYIYRYCQLNLNYRNFLENSCSSKPIINALQVYF